MEDDTKKWEEILAYGYEGKKPLVDKEVWNEYYGLPIKKLYEKGRCDLAVKAAIVFKDKQALEDLLKTFIAEGDYCWAKEVEKVYGRLDQSSEFNLLKNTLKRWGCADVINHATSESYKRLFWDDNVEGKLFVILDYNKRHEIGELAGEIIKNSNSYEDAKNKLLVFYKNNDILRKENRKLIDHYVNKEEYNFYTWDIAYFLNDFWYVKDKYEELAKKFKKKDKNISKTIRNNIKNFELLKMNEELKKELKIEYDPIVKLIMSDVNNTVREIQYKKFAEKMNQLIIESILKN